MGCMASNEETTITHLLEDEKFDRKRSKQEKQVAWPRAFHTGNVSGLYSAECPAPGQVIIDALWTSYDKNGDGALDEEECGKLKVRG